MPPSYRRDPGGGALPCTAYDNTLDLRHQGLHRALAISQQGGAPAAEGGLQLRNSCHRMMQNLQEGGFAAGHSGLISR